MNNISMWFAIAQYLKSDLMRQLESQVNDFMDSLIEESASLEPTPVDAVFSPPLSEKERSKLRYCYSCCFMWDLLEITVHVDRPS